MSSIPIHTGIWTDWSKGHILGQSITVNDSTGVYIITATTTFIGIVASFAWSMAAYMIHQVRVSKDPVDVLHYQQQVSIRNSQSPLGTAWELFQLSTTWSPKKWLFFKKNPTPQAEHIKASSYGLIACALGVWGAFIAAAVVSAKIANPAFQASAVRVQERNCGIWSFILDNTTTHTERDQKILADTLAGRAYARACYANESSFSSVLSCNTYVTRNLPYFGAPLDSRCPFGSRGNVSNQDQPFQDGPCDTEHNTGSYNMSTDLLDSHVHLGINAPEKHRLQFSMSVVCSPLSTNNRTSVSGGDLCPSGVGCNKTYTAYNFGPIGPGLSSYTFLYDPTTPRDIVGYQSSAFYSVGGTTQNWQPITELQLLDGDTTLFLFAANSVEYFNQVDDPFFLALYNETIAVFNNNDVIPYNPFHVVAPMGCVDRYRIVNKAKGQDTGYVSINGLLPAIKNLDLSDAQSVTAQRLYYAFMRSSTYYSIFDSAAGALKASNTIIGYLSPGLPSNQWQLEVEGWFQTSLAKIQAYTVEYSANSVDLGPFGNVSYPDETISRSVWASQCKAQKINSVAGYQTFSLFGLIFTYVVGTVIVCFSILLKPSVSFVRRHCCGGLSRWKGERALVADGKFQLQKMVFQDRGLHGWHDVDNDIPWCGVDAVLRRPKYAEGEKGVYYDDIQDSEGKNVRS